MLDMKSSKRRASENPLELEKGDKPALIIAAFAVLTPVIIAFSAALFLLYFLFTP